MPDSPNKLKLPFYQLFQLKELKPGCMCAENTEQQAQLGGPAEYVEGKQKRNYRERIQKST